MPRQDVPYGGAICRLRERIAEIFDKLGEKLHTINGVPGDGDGNVKIVSGSSAVVINNDPTQNEIAVSLDTSQLPAAAVSSVNGQTGAVALDAGDIPTAGGDVQADLQDLANDISGNTAAINAEVLARQGADSTLQTNINAATASIPGAAAAAVAADTTIVRTSGNQNIADIKTVPTQATGQYSQQIANSQKVRNEIYTYAVTTTGNQSGITGIKSFSTPILTKYRGLSAAGSGWFKVIEFTLSGSPLISAAFIADRNNSQIGILVMVTQSSGNWSISQLGGTLNPANFRLARSADRTKGYLFHNGNRISSNMMYSNFAWSATSMNDTADYIVPTDNNAYAEPTVGDEWQQVTTWS